MDEWATTTTTNSKSPPPDGKAPEPSTRALSRKNRVYVMREFLLETYGDYLRTFNAGPQEGPATVLDVAGGKGDLSWLFCNVDGIRSVVVDPRRTNHRQMLRSVRYLMDHPEEARERAIPGRPTHQPLACLLPDLIKSNHPHANPAFAEEGRTNGADDDDPQPLAFRPQRPQHLRMYVDDDLVQLLRGFLPNTRKASKGIEALSDRNVHEWNSFWEASCRRMNRMDRLACPPPSRENVGGGASGDEAQAWPIANATLALRSLWGAKLVVGFHPDQATEACVDLALLLQIPLAVVPCCVFPSEFPNRVLPSSRAERPTKVRTHDDFLLYLERKHPAIQRKTLSFYETNTARNTVLFTLPGDV